MAGASSALSITDAALAESVRGVSGRRGKEVGPEERKEKKGVGPGPARKRRGKRKLAEERKKERRGKAQASQAVLDWIESKRLKK